MFIPIGGVFLFGDGISPTAGIITALFNLLMAGAALLFGYMYGLMFLIVIGYFIGALGVIMLLLNLFRKRDKIDGNNFQ